jgi:hypothetical protein
MDYYKKESVKMKPSLKKKYLELSKQYGPIKIKCQAADTLPIDAIMDFQGGLKKGTDKNKIKLATRMFSIGFIAPFFVWEHEGDYYNLDGHRRSQVLCELREAGIEIPGMFPVAYIQAGTAEEAKEALLSISSQYGEWDTEELNNWLEDLDDEIRDSLRLLDKEIDISLPIETDDDDEIPEDVELLTKMGDLWELGEHRLLCGDSTDVEQVEQFMNGNKADMVFTDPPYGIDLDTDYKKTFNHDKRHNIKGKKYIQVIGDNKEFNPKAILKIFKNIKELFLWGADYYIWNLPKNGSLFVWDKRASDIDHNYIQKNIDRMGGNHFEICWSKTKHKKEIIRLMWAGLFGMESDKHHRVHPTQKPIRLCELFID